MFLGLMAKPSLYLRYKETALKQLGDDAKMAKMWPDWTFALFVPFSIAILGIFVATIPISIIGLIIYGSVSSSSSKTNSTTSYSSDYDYSSTDYYDGNNDSDSQEDDESEEERHGIYRSPGECYYDGNGIYRSPDESFYDGGN